MTEPTKTEKLTPRHSVSRRWMLLIPLSIAAGFAILAMSNSTGLDGATADDASERAPAPLPVNTRVVHYESKISQTRSYTGTIRAKQSSDLAFELPGTIIEILVSEGDEVERGQTLAKLDTKILQARKAAVVAQLDQSRAMMDELNAGPREESINASRERVNAAMADFKMAELNFQRRQRLYDGNAISAEEFDQARFGLQSAHANLRSTKEQLSELETGTRKEQLTAQSSAVRRLEASLDEIVVSLEKSHLTAPYSGTVSRRHVDSGSIANAAAPVLRLIESSSLEALIGLPADVAAKLDIGSMHTLSIGDRQVQAKLRSRVREIDPVTRTQNILLDVQSKDVERVVPGELCEWKIQQQSSHSGFWIPASALSRGMRGLWSVMVLETTGTGTAVARKHDIEIVLTESDKVLARGTLIDGDEIVIDGVHRIANGQTVVATRTNSFAPEQENGPLGQQGN